MSKKKKAKAKPFDIEAGPFKFETPGEIVPFQVTPPPVEFFDFLAMVEKLVMGEPLKPPTKSEGEALLEALSATKIDPCACPMCQAERAAAAAAREQQTDEIQSFPI